MRSPRQQARIDKLVKFLETYKGKSVTTDIVAKEVERIWGVSGGSKKLSDLRTTSPEVFTGVKIVKLTEQSPWNIAWENDPEFKKFFKEKKPNLDWNKIPYETREIKRNVYDSYLIDVNKNKKLPKGFITREEFGKETGIKKSTIQAIFGKKQYNNLRDKLNKEFKSVKIGALSYFPPATDENVLKFTKLFQENRAEGVGKSKNINSNTDFTNAGAANMMTKHVPYAVRKGG